MIEDLNQKKAILTAIIDSSEDAIISKDLNGMITSWNKAAERMFGYLEAETIGKHISILIPKDRIQEEEMIISNLRQGKRIEHYETVRLTKTGKEIIISLTVSPIKNAGVIIGASKIARDITRQKEIEASLKQYTEQLEFLNAFSQTIASELDMNTIVQKVTDAVTEISGAEFGAFIYNKTGTKVDISTLIGLSPAYRELLQKSGITPGSNDFKTNFNVKAVFRSGDINTDPGYVENLPRFYMPDEGQMIKSYLVVPVMSKSGIASGCLFLGHSKPAMFSEQHERIVVAISNHVAISLDNSNLYEEIKTLSNKKDEFIGFASHELKTPLTTISGYVQLAQATPELAAELIPKMSKQVHKLTAIISDLLDISKIEANKFDLNYTKTSLFGLIGENVESVKQNTHTHQIDMELPKEDIAIVVDAQKMGQTLINLLTNAVKYSPDSKRVLVTASVEGEQVHISIRDWGIGIDPVHLDKIFTRFYRVESTKNKTEGLGVGLYLAQEVVTAHRGRIWVESEPGKGSVFNISFLKNYPGMVHKQL